LLTRAVRNLGLGPESGDRAPARGGAAVDAEEGALGDLVPGLVRRALGGDGDGGVAAAAAALEEVEGAAVTEGVEDLAVADEEVGGARLRAEDEGRLQEGGVGGVGGALGDAGGGARPVEGGEQEGEEALAVGLAPDLAAARGGGVAVERGGVGDGAVVGEDPAPALSKRPRARSARAWKRASSLAQPVARYTSQRRRPSETARPQPCG
jgi:hypothetical protein